MTGQNISNSRARSHSGVAGKKNMSATIGSNLAIGDEAESVEDGLSIAGAKVQRLFSLLNELPDAKPPAGLVQRTMKRIARSDA